MVMAMSVFLVCVHVFTMVRDRSRSEEHTGAFNISPAFALAAVALARKRQEATAGKPWGSTIRLPSFGGVDGIPSPSLKWFRRVDAHFMLTILCAVGNQVIADIKVLKT
jgi:hypothetical protein